MKSFQDVESDQAALTLQLLATKAMNRAKYFCSGMLDIAKYHHYALNVPLYTHFTSPIRRYADVMVHRQLDAILLGGALFVFIDLFSRDERTQRPTLSSTWTQKASRK